MPSTTRRIGTSLTTFVLVLAAACSSDRPTEASLALQPESDGPNLLRVHCAADVASRTIRCGATEAAASASLNSATASGSKTSPPPVSLAGLSHTFGGQGTYVNLVSSSVTYIGTTFSFNTTVQNLTNMAMATEDGATRENAGVRIFFQTAPHPTAGSGAITVNNADGVDTFLASNQTYYQYGGQIGGVDQGELGADGILSSVETSSAKSWQFDVPGSVTSFAFEVYVNTLTAAGAVSTVAPQVSSIGVPSLVPGTTAVLTGVNFNTTPASNVVMVGGRQATVTGATATTLNITVPCVANGSQDIQVTTGGMRGARHAFPVAVSQRTIGVGQLLVLNTSADSYCNELTSANGTARYVVSVFNAGSSPTISTNFQLSGDLGQAPVPLYRAAEAPPVAKSISVVEGPLKSIAAANAEMAQERIRDERHAGLLEKNSAAYATLRSKLGTAPTRQASRMQFAGPPATRTFRVPNINVASICNSYYVVSARLVTTSGKVAIYEDDATPAAFKYDANATMSANYTKIADQFNADMEPVIRNNFGDLLVRDAVLDNDGLVNLLFSPVVNANFAGFAGFTVSCDQLPNDDANSPAVGGPYTGSAVSGSSNFGEVFYGYLPVTTGSGYAGNTADNWYRTIRSTIVHELKHLSSLAAHVNNGAPSQEVSWLEEGSARIAEEIWMRETVDNVAWKANTGYGTSVNPINIYCDARPGFAECDANPRRPASIMQRHFTSLYTQLFSTNARLLSPFGRTPNDNASYFYAISWSFLRYSIDRYGVSDAAFLTALNQSTTTGVTNVTAVSGASINQLLGGWAISLAADDHPLSVTPDNSILMPTWNFRNIYAGLNTDFPGSYTLAYPLTPQVRTFSTFAPVGVAVIYGGGVIWYEISGTQSLPQLLRLETNTGGLPNANMRLAITRLH